MSSFILYRSSFKSAYFIKMLDDAKLMRTKNEIWGAKQR